MLNVLNIFKVNQKDTSSIDVILVLLLLNLNIFSATFWNGRIHP